MTRNRKAIVALLLASTALVACAQGRGTGDGLVAANPVESDAGVGVDAPAGRKSWLLDAPEPVTVAHERIPTVEPSDIQVRRIDPKPEGKRPTGIEAVTREQQDALNIPVSGRTFIGAATNYAYKEGAIYRVFTAPYAVTTIALAPGEILNDTVLGDTYNWQIETSQVGEGPTARALIFITAYESNHRSNLTITTNQRIYLLDLEARREGEYQTQVAWRYPEEEFRQQVAQRKAAFAERERRPITQVDLGAVQLTYKIATTSGPEPDWKPILAFHDGTRTFIQFPKGVTTRPPLFVKSGNTSAIVNYRTQDEYYVIDRVIDAAVLKFGTDPQTIVTISSL